MTVYKLCKCGKKIQSHLRSCDECAKKVKRVFNRDYDRFKRNKESAKFYNSYAWKKLRNAFIKENPFCVKCGKFANIVDHIKPIRQGGERLGKENLQSLCTSCHNKKTNDELMGRGFISLQS